VDRWETDKKLERKVAQLAKKLEERSKELEAARGQTEQARQLLERATKDRATLQARLSRAGGASPTQQDHQRGHSEDKEQQLEQLRSELQRARDTQDTLRRVAEVDQRAEIARLTREVASTRARAVELEEEVASLRERRRGAKSGGGDTLQGAEDFYAREDELRAQLTAARKEARAAQAELIDKDNKLLEARFEMERLELAAAAAERRAADEATTFRAAGGPKRGAGESFKRERDLEAVVEALKRVVGKQQAENDRLRKTAAGSAKLTELGKQVKQLATDKNELVAANEGLQRRAQSAAESSAKAVRLEDALRTAKRQLKDREASEKRAELKIAQLDEERVRLTEELEQASARLLSAVSGGGGSEAAELRRRLQEAQRQLELARRGQASAALQDENARLRDENERLLQELNAFDAGFFQEVEDLKWRYSVLLQEKQDREQQDRRR
jgi:hypothetical protein